MNLVSTQFLFVFISGIGIGDGSNVAIKRYHESRRDEIENIIVSVASTLLV